MFQVHPAALDTFAARLDALAADARTAHAYARTHLTVPWYRTGLFFTVNIVLDDVCEAVSAAMSRLGELSSASAAELRAAASSYRSIDRAIAEQMDASYPSDGPR